MRSQLKAGTLAPERREKLLALDFPADNKEAKFRQSLALLAAYYKENGHLLVPQSYQVDGVRLGKVVNSLRSRYGKGQLSQNHIRRLESIGMAWKTK